MKYFTYLWTRDGFTSKQIYCEATNIYTSSHAVGSEFIERNVSPGDFVYIIHMYKSEIYILTRLEVDKITTSEEAAKHFGLSSNELWGGPEHILARSPSPIYFDRVLTAAQVDSIRYYSFTQKKYIPPKFKEYGIPDQMSIRGVRQLSSSSAGMLSNILDI
jgi:hypothetical protein